MELKGRIVVFSIVGCPHCLRAKNKLNNLGLPYHDISLDFFPQLRDAVKELTGGKSTVPQIFFNEIYIGGNDDLESMANDEKRLQGLIEMVKTTEAPSTAPQIPDPTTAVNYGKHDGVFVCEPDEYALLVKEMRAANLIRDHKTDGLLLSTTHKNTFKGQHLVDWLVNEKHFDERKALEVGQQLISKHFGHPSKSVQEDAFNPDLFYRLLEDEENGSLNASGPMSECSAIPAGELGELLRRLILNIYSDAISKDGKHQRMITIRNRMQDDNYKSAFTTLQTGFQVQTVDYKAIAKSKNFGEYVTMTKELRRVEIAGCSREEKLAFFINIYNALVIHGTVKLGPPTNIWQRWKFFNTVSYIIGGHTYSLQDIENGVLRANRKGVGMFRRPFGKDDPRLKIALEEAEPLIHFALNCGAKSCPPIKTFTAKGINAELKVAAESFLETDDGVKVDAENRKISLSQIFKWYSEDFGGTPTKAAEWVSVHMDNGDKKKSMESVIKSDRFSVNFMPYDWGHNGKQK